MRVTVELFGLARYLAGVRAVSLEVPEGARLRDVTAALGQAHPQLLGRVIAPDGQGLLEPYFYARDGRTVLHNPDSRPCPDDALCLLFVAAGG